MMTAPPTRLEAGRSGQQGPFRPGGPRPRGGGPAWRARRRPPTLAAFPLVADLLRRYGSSEGRSRFERSAAYLAVRAESDSGAASLCGQFTAPYAVERAVRLDRMPRSAPVTDAAVLRAIRCPALVVGGP